MPPQGNFDGVTLSADEQTLTIDGTTTLHAEVRQMHVSLAFDGKLLHPFVAVDVDGRWSVDVPNTAQLRPDADVVCVGLGLTVTGAVFHWDDPMTVFDFDRPVLDPGRRGGEIDDVDTPPLPPE